MLKINQIYDKPKVYLYFFKEKYLPVVDIGTYKYLWNYNYYVGT